MPRERFSLKEGSVKKGGLNRFKNLPKPSIAPPPQETDENQTDHQKK